MLSSQRSTAIASLSSLIMLCGCSLLPQPHSANNPTVQPTGCSETPTGYLDKKNVKMITLSSQNLNQSGTLRAGQNLGYTFKGKAKQKFNFQTKENLCIWIYTPGNELLNGGELPVDGQYTVQIGLSQGSTSFNIEMSLTDSQSVIAAEPPSPTPAFSPTLIPQPTTNAPSQSNPPEPEPPSSSPSTGNQKLDDMADSLFNERHPELGGRKIQSSETALVAEWNEIRQCDAIVDSLFYDRNPQLNGRKIVKGETALQREWWSLRDQVSGCN
jgi:hypothetical protein